jgi:surface polysaccharide O-acyltransferase-like enzyme
MDNQKTKQSPIQNGNTKNSAPFSADLIRTVAIFLIILLHATNFPPQIPLNITPQVAVGWFTADAYAAVGHIGVPLFVMLSGFLLLQPEKTDEPLRVFFKKRFNRIGLPFIFWSIIYFFWNVYVHNMPLTLDGAVKAFMSGTYIHLWFLYLLVGLYLITPLLRVFVKYLDSKRLKYLAILWFIGTSVIWFVNTFGPFNFNTAVFVFTGWSGYYILGAFLQKVKVRTWILVMAACLGIAVAIFGAYGITRLVGERVTEFFHDSLNFNMIIASVAVYLLLINIPVKRLESHNPKVNAALHWIGQNTLPIYLMHFIILECFIFGFFGFHLNEYTLNPIIEIPLLTLVTFALTAALVYPLKKIPIVKRLIG